MKNLEKKLSEQKPYFIAEMSANHGNDLEIALRTVDAAAEAGADCLKVQTYTADTLTLDCDNRYFMIEGGLWDGRKLYDLYSEASMPWEWHAPIKERCEQLGMDFLSTPFDKSAVDFLDDLGCKAYKIASFELVDIPLIEYAASKGKPMIMSTGMATAEEIQEAVDAVHRMGNDKVMLLRCCSEYPAAFSDMNLSTIPDMANRYGCPIGFSDHSMGHLADVVAATLGAKIIEKHFCLDRNVESADASFSMTPAEYRAMVEAVQDAVSALGVPEYGPTATEHDSLAFRRSIFCSKDIKKGEAFSEENVRIVRPSYGAKPKYYAELLQRTSDRDYSFGEPIEYGE